MGKSLGKKIIQTKNIIQGGKRSLLEKKYEDSIFNAINKTEPFDKTIHELRKQIKKYRRLKEKGIPRFPPFLKVDNTIRNFDKIEDDGFYIYYDAESKEKPIIKINIKEGDTLQVGHKQIEKGVKRKKALSQLQENDSETTERSELQDKERIAMGKICTYKYKFFLPKNYPISTNRLVLGQRKQSAMEGVHQNPLISNHLQNGIFYVAMNTSGDPTGKSGKQKILKINPEKILGEWIECEYTIKYSEKEDGFIKINIIGKDRKRDFEYNGRVSQSNKNYPIGEYYKDDFYFKFGLYKDNYNASLNRLRKQLGKNDKEDKILKEKIREIKEIQEKERKGEIENYILFKDYKKMIQN